MNEGCRILSDEELANLPFGPLHPETHFQLSLAVLGGTQVARGVAQERGITSGYSLRILSETGRRVVS